MTRHDEAALWDYAARELDPAERRVVEGHLEDCLECREQLASVQVAREALEAARQAMPFIGWDAVDEAVGRVVEKRLGAQARRPMLRRAVGGAALLAAGMALALMAPNRPATLPQEPLAVEAPPAPAAQSRVARAEGLSLVGTRGALLDGRHPDFRRRAGDDELGSGLR
jgi:anti-sigma factor RsiW